MNSISSRTPLEEESPIVSTPSQMSKVNTNYLDRFLRASSIAPDLIRMHVFPNVKELTESMAVYYHTHNYILSKQEIKESDGVVKDAILCIGDGSTPRSASIFALSYPEWQCYSIDPQLQEGYIRTGEKEKDKLKHDMSKLRQERRSLWESIPNLHIVGECIEKVRIHCRRAVIVMVHCHLSFQQIMSSIECEEIAGVISLPCCNFFQIQEKFMGQLPSYEFHDDGIWSDKNTVRIWEHPSIQWIEDYHSYLDDSCILPYQLDTSAILSSSDLQRIPLNTHTTVVGEITAIRKFGKKLTFVFINTSNVYYCSNSNQYWYYENHAYDVHNTCLNAAPILLKCDANSLPSDQYQQLYSCILTLKNHCLIQGEGNVILSKQGKKIVDLLDLKLLNSNKQLANAQRMICGVDFDFLDLPCVNERNINYCNKDLGMLIVC